MLALQVDIDFEQDSPRETILPFVFRVKLEIRFGKFLGSEFGNTSSLERDGFFFIVFLRLATRTENRPKFVLFVYNWVGTPLLHF